jgi:hypothetical protein
MRQVNAGLKDATWPIPNIQELLDRTRNCTTWSVIDLVQGYQQMRITPESEHLTAFRTPLGVYCWRTLPQGCKVPPAAFFRMIDANSPWRPFICFDLPR